MRLRSAVGAAGLAAWVLVPLGLAAWVVTSQREDASQSPAATWAPVTTAEGAIDVPAVVLLEWGAVDPAPAPGWSGLVQEVLLEPGSPVATGVSVARIGGVVRIATSVATPIERQLSQGDRGPDVAALNQTLAALGRQAADGDRFTAATAAGVRGLAEDLGAGTTTVFDPSWLVFLPDGDGVVASVDLGVGRPAPAPGEPVLELEPVLRRARVVGVDDVGAPDGFAGGDAERGRVDLDAIDSTLDLSAGSAVVVDGEEVDVDPAGEVAPAAFGRLASLADDGERLPATVRPAVTDELFQVPSAAVFAGPDGSTCVHLRRDGADTVAPVEVADSYIGTAFVTGDVVAGDVEVDPPTGIRARCR